MNHLETLEHQKYQAFQTRSEATGIQYFEHIRRALDAAEKDPTIWKISFSTPNGDRIRLNRVSMSRNIKTWILDLFPD